jgi:hypothetical protein
MGGYSLWISTLDVREHRKMNKSLIFVYWGGFMLEAIVFDTYKVEYEDNAIHVTFGDNIKCTKEDLDKVDISYYELQNV